MTVRCTLPAAVLRFLVDTGADRTSVDRDGGAAANDTRKDGSAPQHNRDEFRRQPTCGKWCSAGPRP
jgi:hypothetical protein